MDPTTAVRTDALPAIATLITPGALASSPYVWVVLSHTPKLGQFLDSHEALAAATALLLWIAIGFAIDSAGSYIEVYAIDKRRKDYNDFLETWWRYLTIAWSNEPVGQRYLRRLLVTFKFELNMSCATVLSLPGIILLAVFDQMRYCSALGTVSGLLIFAALLFFAARGSSEVLAQARRHLVQGVWEPQSITS